MEEFPAQSHKSREPREIQPVTTTAGRVRKAPSGQRFLKTIFQGDAQSVWTSMIWDTFFPNLRDNFADAVHNGVDALFGGYSTSARSRSRRNWTNQASRSGVSKHSPDHALGRDRSSERYSDEARRNQDLSVIEIDSRVEAQEVLNQMNLMIDQYDVCSLADFYQMVRITPAHTDYKFGWEDIGGAHVVSSRGSYYLELPKPIQLR